MPVFTKNNCSEEYNDLTYNPLKLIVIIVYMQNQIVNTVYRVFHTKVYL